MTLARHGLVLALLAIIGHRSGLPAAAAGAAIFEAETLHFITTTADPIGPQPMAGFGPHWGGDAQLFWGATADGEQMVLTLDVPSGGGYEVVVKMTRAPDFGRVGVALDGASPIEFDGYATGVSIAELPLGVVDLSAGEHRLSFRVLGRNASSAGRFMGVDRIELHPRTTGGAQRRVVSSGLLAKPLEAVRAEAEIEPWTTQDVIDPRIDVSAQYALMRMFRGDVIERVAASNILSAVKAAGAPAATGPGQVPALDGIYQEDQKVPALRAQKQGFGWWQILPKPPPGGSLDGVCLDGEGGESPILVMRKGAEKNATAYDRSLLAAWHACGFAPVPVRPYRATPPPKPQAAAKAGRCASPHDRSTLAVTAFLDRKPNDFKAVAGARVTVEASGVSTALSTDEFGLAFFDLPKAGLYRVTAEGGSPALPYPVSASVEVLPSCANSHTFSVDDASPAPAGASGGSSCHEVLARASWTCLTPEFLAGLNQCNEAYGQALLQCRDVELSVAPLCESKAVGNYDQCVAPVHESRRACERREAGPCLGGV